MLLKSFTPEIKNILTTQKPLEISADLAVKARSLSIKEIYFLPDLDLSDYGVYGNHVVLMADGQYIDYTLSPENAVRTIIDLLSQEEMQ